MATDTQAEGHSNHERVAVTGGRDFADPAMVRLALGRLDPSAVLVHGAARGADTLSATQWIAWGRRVEAWPANWREHGKGAGPRRNQAMVDSGLDLLVAFPGGKGTADMVARCHKAGVPVIFAEQLPITAGGAA